MIYRNAFTHIPALLKTSLSENITYHCLPPILPTVPPWAMTPPQVILSLSNLPKKSTSPKTYRSHFLEILDTFPNTTLCFTDGSKTPNGAAYAFSIGEHTFARRHRNPASILTTELQAIFDCLKSILNLSSPPSLLPS